MNLSSEVAKIERFIPRLAKVLSHETVGDKLYFTYEHNGNIYSSSLCATDYSSKKGQSARRRKRLDKKCL